MKNIYTNKNLVRNIQYIKIYYKEQTLESQQILPNIQIISN